MKRLFIALALLAPLAALGFEDTAYAAATAASVTKQSAAAAAAGSKSATATARVGGTVITTTVAPAPASQKTAPQAPRPGTRPKTVRVPRFHAFCPAGATPSEIADRVEASYKADSTGHKRLKGCHGNPVQFIAAFNQGDPDAHLTDKDSFLRYLRDDLVITKVSHRTQFYSSCLYGKSDEADDVFMKCDPQTIAPNEVVYANKHTGRAVYKQGCANPGLMLVKAPPCAYVLFPAHASRNDKYVSIAAMGDVTPEEEADCPISIQGPVRAGQMLSPGGYQALTELPEHPCDWQEVADYVRLPIYKTGCVRVSDGWYALRLPLRFATSEMLRAFFCITKADGTTVEPVGALPPEYHRQQDGSMVATLWYSEREVPRAHAGTILYWHWMN